MATREVLDANTIADDVYTFSEGDVHRLVLVVYATRSEDTIIANDYI